MKRSIQSILGSLFLATMGLSAHATEAEPATLKFHDQGFTVEAPLGASMLEVRLMGPERTLLFAAHTAGEAIDWRLSGDERDGEYRYEAVVVMDIDGEPHQSNWPGGFEVTAGFVVAPPLPVHNDDLITLDSKHEH